MSIRSALLAASSLFVSLLPLAEAGIPSCCVGGWNGTHTQLDSCNDCVGETSLYISGNTKLVIAAGAFSSENLSTVTYLDLGYNQLSSLPLGVFQNLTSLQYLYLYGNQLSSLPVGVFQDLTSLQYLNLGDNQLSSLPVGVFQDLTSLQTLDLYINQLSSLPVGVFQDLTSLQTLYLGDNRLSSLPVGVFQDLTSLQYLWLNTNQLSSLPVGVFQDLTSLQYLWLSDNQLSSLPVGVFQDLTSLQYLSLHYNQLSSLPVGVFQNLTSLQHLSLDYNQLSSLPVGVFQNLTSLQQLYLHENQLSSLPAGVFQGLTSLQYLNLTGNQLSSLPVGVFQGLASLQSLDLYGNQLSSLPVGVFQNLTSLQYLDLHDNQLSSLPVGVFQDQTALSCLYLGTCFCADLRPSFDISSCGVSYGEPPSSSPWPSTTEIATATSSASATRTRTATATGTSTRTGTATATNTRTATATSTGTATRTATATRTVSPTQSSTSSATATASSSASPSRVVLPSVSPSSFPLPLYPQPGPTLKKQNGAQTYCSSASSVTVPAAYVGAGFADTYSAVMQRQTLVNKAGAVNPGRATAVNSSAVYVVDFSSEPDDASFDFVMRGSALTTTAFRITLARTVPAVHNVTLPTVVYAGAGENDFTWLAIPDGTFTAPNSFVTSFAPADVGSASGVFAIGTVRGTSCVAASSPLSVRAGDACIVVPSIVTAAPAIHRYTVTTQNCAGLTATGTIAIIVQQRTKPTLTITDARGDTASKAQGQVLYVSVSSTSTSPSLTSGNLDLMFKLRFPLAMRLAPGVTPSGAVVLGGESARLVRVVSVSPTDTLTQRVTVLLRVPSSSLNDFVGVTAQVARGAFVTDAGVQTSPADAPVTVTNVYYYRLRAAETGCFRAEWAATAASTYLSYIPAGLFVRPAGALTISAAQAVTEDTAGLAVTLGPLGRALVRGTVSGVPAASTAGIAGEFAGQPQVIFQITAVDEAGVPASAYLCIRVQRPSTVAARTARLAMASSALTVVSGTPASNVDSASTFSSVGHILSTGVSVRVYVEAPLAADAVTEALSCRIGGTSALAYTAIAAASGGLPLGQGTSTGSAVLTSPTAIATFVQSVTYEAGATAATGNRVARIVVLGPSAETGLTLPVVLASATRTITVTTGTRLLSEVEDAADAELDGSTTLDNAAHDVASPGHRLRSRRSLLHLLVGDDSAVAGLV